MRTDWTLIRRAAEELDARFRGAKVRDVGLLADGRVAIALWSRGVTSLLCFDVFGTPPLVTVEDGELPIATEPGFVRALGAALRGTVLTAARSRTGDRLLRITFGARSRFGVGDEVDLYAELVPRFGNVVLVKGGTIVAAAKEFSLADNGTRAVLNGMRYELPPLIARDAPAAPAVPDGASVLDAFAAYRGERLSSGRDEAATRRRTALLKRLDERMRKAGSELAKVAAKREKALARDALRSEGESIFATLYDLSEVERDQAKEQAATLFAQYKKLGASLPHLELREAALRETLRAIEELRWEAERTDDGDLDDVERAVESLEPRAASPPKAAARKRKRALLEVRTGGGSRILIGRSPSENADLTFRVARPNDLWFHAQNIPGAHVILQRDDRDPPPEEDVLRAASLAAFYSKAKASARVAIDYTERKYVRAQRNAPPGLVWYTNPRTVVVTPEVLDDV
jgi:predicted ribosome quality control (RQC) complex YloA/Tae2 family protein